MARFKLDANGNVPGDINSELDDGVRQKATAKLPTFSISIQQLKTKVVAKSEKPITIEGSKTLDILAYQDSVSSASKNIGAFLLVYAYSKTEGAKFKWTQEYRTERLQGKDELMHTQYVQFQNISGGKIELEYIIYAVLEN